MEFNIVKIRSKYIQEGFQAFGLLPAWLLAFMQHLLHSVAFCCSTVGHPCPAVYLISACVVLPCACSSGSWHFPSPPSSPQP